MTRTTATPSTDAAPPVVARPDRTALCAAYLGVQALAGIAWWCVLAFVPEWREPFELAAERHQVLDAFFVADATIFIGGSAVSAWALRQRTRWAPAAAIFTAGGVVYATLYLGQWVALNGTGAIGLVPMGLATVATVSIAVHTWWADA